MAINDRRDRCELCKNWVKGDDGWGLCELIIQPTKYFQICEKFRQKEKIAVIHYEWRNKTQDVVMGGRHLLFKSKIEYRYAQYLQKLLELGAIDFWGYENKTFEFAERYRKRSIYTPDFEVHETHCGHKLISWHEVKTSLRQNDIRRFKLMAADYPMEEMVLVLPYCSHNTKQSRLRGNAQKYVRRIFYCDPYFRKFGIK